MIIKSNRTTKVAVITGASRGIGRAVAATLAKEGMYVVVNYFAAAEEAKQVVNDINRFSKAIAVRADVTDTRQVEALVNETIETFGQVDVLVNNAGVILRPGDWQNITDEVWQRTLDVNLKGSFNCIRYFAPFLRESYGKIVNTTSTYGILGAAPVVAYTTAKAGIINLTRAFAKELAPAI